MHSIELIDLAITLGKAVLLTAAALVVAAVPLAAHRLSEGRRQRSRAKVKHAALCRKLNEAQARLAQTTELATRYYRSMSKATDLALYSVRKEIFRLTWIRDEAERLLAANSCFAFEAAEAMLESANALPAANGALQELCRPAVLAGDTSNEFAALDTLLNFVQARIELDLAAVEEAVLPGGRPPCLC